MFYCMVPCTNKTKGMSFGFASQVAIDIGEQFFVLKLSLSANIW